MDNRRIRVVACEAVFAGRTLPPLHVGDVITVALTMFSTEDTARPGVETHRVTVRPVVGRSPHRGPDGSATWPHLLHGDGWEASWSHHSPVQGPARVTGSLWVDFADPVRGWPGAVTGRVCGLQDIESGVLVEIDLDDVPDGQDDVHPNGLAIHGDDLWVMDAVAPRLLHVDLSCEPFRVTEYLLPLALEEAAHFGPRRVLADGAGCWVTCPAEIVRCDRDAGGVLTSRRVAERSDGIATLAAGRLSVVGLTSPSLRDHPRYGPMREDPAEHPVHELVEDELVPVDDPETVELARRALYFPGRVHSPDALYQAVGGRLERVRDDETRTVDLAHRARGEVRWVEPDPRADPRIDELVQQITFIPSGPPPP